MIKALFSFLPELKVSILNTTKNFCRLLELNNAELMLTTELVKLLETQLGKKTNLKKVG